MKYDYVVVGAGFAGAIVAQQLHAAGKKVLVVEKRDHIGGNAYDEYNGRGVLIHRYGPHIFNTNSDKIIEYLSQFTDWNEKDHRVVAHSRYGWLPIPVNRRTIEMVYDVELESEAATQRFLDEIRFDHITEPRNVKEAVQQQVGDLIYYELFEGYTRKMWGRDPEELDPSVVGRLRARTSDDDRYFTSKFQALPSEGYTAMFERILDGIDVELNIDAFDLLGPSTAQIGHLVWTGPIDEAYDFKYGRLPWRSLTFEHVDLSTRFANYGDVGQRQPTPVVNYPSGLAAWTRVTNWRMLTGQADEGWDTITTEFPVAGDGGDPFYPVPSREARKLYEKYGALAKADAAGVTFVGRLARYQYLAMPQVVGQALKAAKDLLAR